MKCFHTCSQSGECVLSVMFFFFPPTGAVLVSAVRLTDTMSSVSLKRAMRRKQIP